MEKIIIISLAVFSSLYSLLLDAVRYKSSNNPTPQSVADVYDSETYLKWKRYSAEHCKLSIVFTLINCAVTLILLLTNAFAFFASLFPNNYFGQIVSVIILINIVDLILSVPKEYVSNMVIEQKYGFNKTTMRTFVGDCIRNFIIEFLVSLGLALLISFLHMKMGVWMIVLFAIVVFLFTLLISFLYPILSRIGNKFTPLEDGELKDRLVNMLSKYGYKVKAIEVMDASRRTTKLNAYFTGFGKLKTIVLYDNLVNAMTSEEICAVFAHEMGHGIHNDVTKQQGLNIVNLTLMGVAAWLTVSITGIYTAFGFEELNYGFAFVVMGYLISIIQPLLSMVVNAYSRSAEYRADMQAVKEGYGEPMVTALKKLAKDNFAHLAPSKLNVVLEYSHPPLASRIDQIINK